MPEFKEKIMSTLWQRLDGVTGKVSIARNSKVEPNVNDMPAIRFFELEDTVEKLLSTGATKFPAYQRKLTVAIECFVSSTAEGKVSQDLLAFVGEIKKKLYEGGNTLGLQCKLFEVESSKVFRPPVGKAVAGISIIIDILYVEDISKLF